MRFLYLDSSGDSGWYHPHPTKGSRFRYYILGGLALDTSRWYPTKVALEGVLTKYFGKDHPPEVHFSKIRRKKPPFKSVDSAKLMDDLVQMVVDTSPVLFGIVVDKLRYQQKYSQPDPIPTFCLDAVTSRFQEYLQRTRDQGAMVSDRSHHESDDVLMGAFEHMKKHGTAFVSVNRIMDTLFFAPSETAIGIQLADIVGNIIFRNYEWKDTTYFKKIHPLFDRSGSIMHGLRVYPP